jgi:hypothetical protein
MEPPCCRPLGLVLGPSREGGIAQNTRYPPFSLLVLSLSLTRFCSFVFLVLRNSAYYRKPLRNREKSCSVGLEECAIQACGGLV